MPPTMYQQPLYQAYSCGQSFIFRARGKGNPPRRQTRRDRSEVAHFCGLHQPSSTQTQHATNQPTNQEFEVELSESIISIAKNLNQSCAALRNGRVLLHLTERLRRSGRSVEKCSNFDFNFKITWLGAAGLSRPVCGGCNPIVVGCQLEPQLLRAKISQGEK